MGPRSSSPANMDASVSQTCFYTVPSLVPSEDVEFLPTYMSVVYALALKQTQAVDEQLKTETQAEVSTDSPVPVSIEAVSTRCKGVCELPLLSWICVWEEISKHFALLGLHFWAECVVSPVVTALNQAELKK